MTDGARKSLIRAFYLVMKSIGLFRLSRRLTRDGIRILGYHGFTMRDEDRFVPGLFIDPRTFEQRLRYLADGNFPVLSLTDAIRRQRDGTLPDCATVITIDDGFHSVRHSAAGLLRRFDFPSTLYLTSQFFERQIPFLNLVIDYICWNPGRTRVDLSRIAIPALREVGEIELKDDDARDIAIVVKQFLTTQCDEPDQVPIVRQLGEALGVDYDTLAESRFLSTVSADELKEMLDMGMDVQLHTHRHFFPVDPDIAFRELDDNRAAIAAVTPERPVHFAYPRGEWSKEHWPLLEKAGIETATTCESGLVYRDTPPYALNRIIDSARIAPIEFEAEMSGFTELIRRVRGKRQS